MLLSHMESRLFSSSFRAFVLITLSFCFHSASCAVHSNETDRLALLAFKASITDDPLGALSSWNNSIHFCQWSGVTCCPRRQRVVVLDLHSHNLAGSISPIIGNLSFLREVYLQNNSLSKEIPPEVGRLRRLQTFSLGNNSLGGEIPVNLTSCHDLININLDYNRLQGKIPSEIGSLTKLQVLSAIHNNLTGDIPSSVGNLSSLVTFSMSINHLIGHIPNALGQLKNISTLAISENYFEGSLPPSIFNLSSIVKLDLGVNLLYGNLPFDLFSNFPQISYFNVLCNDFTGPIPSSLSNASNLEYFYLGDNNLTGKVPNLEKLHKLQVFAIAENFLGFGEADELSFLSSLTNATNLHILQITRNGLGGALPESIGNLSRKLQMFSIEGNKILGTIPTCIGNLKSLETLGLSGNHLSGSVPETIGNLQQLQIAYLSDNEFTGNIPSSIGNLNHLTKLIFKGNNLEGTIPPSLGNCTNLLLLTLGNNKINGTIPTQLFNISSLAIALILSDNHLTGVLPFEVGNLKNLGGLRVDGNRLSGEIPSSLGSCASLQRLRLDNNVFRGTIPLSLSSLKGLESLDVSRNNLSGEIPKFLGDLVLLKELNLSFNNFVGMVPSEGVFKNASEASLEGNKKLCGGMLEFHLQMCNINERSRHRLKIVIFIVFVCLGAVVIAIFLLIFWFRKRNEKTIPPSSENSLLQVSYHTLSKATNGFSISNLIGVGGFGCVYKGILDEERVVAIKVFNLQRKGALKSFIAECVALKNIRHRYLVKVITACSSIDSQSHDFKALIYEFMVNGSLEEWLHPNFKPDAYDVKLRLNLVQRLAVAIDVASALDYLHYQYCDTPIVHCDLKPSNILLDDEMTAQVGDFGLVKFLSEESNNTHRGQASSAGVRGTVGYAPPEYGMGSEVSTQGDVYSYGILLLEMFSGKKPTDDIFCGNTNIHNYVKRALPQQVVDITEPMLLEGRKEDKNDNSSETNLQIVIDSLVLIFGIGIACSEERPTERMNINDALAKLLVIKGTLIDNGAQVPKMPFGEV